MRRKSSRYPVGATWVAKSNQMSAKIWLSKRTKGGLEIWNWWHSRGTGGRTSDWGQSRRVVKDECPYVRDSLGKIIRFKRAEVPDAKE